MGVPATKRWREAGGRLCHDGDCLFWGERLCTCGLIHHVQFFAGEDDGAAAAYAEEWGAHARTLAKLPGPDERDACHVRCGECERLRRAECDRLLMECFGPKGGPRGEARGGPPAAHPNDAGDLSRFEGEGGLTNGF